MSNRIDNDGAANAVADEIVSLSNTRTKLLADKEAELQAVRARYEPVLDTLATQIKAKAKALQGYCSRKAVAARLFASQRFVDSATARFGFRDSPPALKTLDTSAKLDDVAADLLDKGLRQYVTVPQPKPALDKQAIMAAGLDAGQLANLGLRIVTPTTFYCEPLDGVITKATTVKSEQPQP